MLNYIDSLLNLSFSEAPQKSHQGKVDKGQDSCKSLKLPLLEIDVKYF